MTADAKNKITVLLTAGVLLSFSAWNLAKPDGSWSLSERRKLTQLPSMTSGSVLSGRFMESFETYAADQFPLREAFRGIKSCTAYFVFGQKDNNGIYVSDGHIASMEYPLTPSSVERAAGRFRYLYETYMKNTDVKIYGAVVPDKNYYLAGESGHLAMDYDALCSELYQETDFINYIDLTDLLSPDAYYRTDPHWKQPEITDAAERIAGAMDADIVKEYEEVTLDVPFYGAYYGQAALPLSADSISYLTNDALRQCKVINYETMSEGPVYDLEKAEGRDPYEMFLSGSVSLLTIENPCAANNRELIIFRDSFGSSIAPLLATAYAKTTLVDIRYLKSSSLAQFIDFTDQDILFLYSTSVLNHGETLK